MELSVVPAPVLENSAPALFALITTYVHTKGIPEEGWVVDIEKCACACKFYSKLKTRCHISVGRKPKRRQNRKAIQSSRPEN
ncbi:hypothetical protein PHMEG_00015094 [Phytophthora megakarya]|uniref:Uncharacterized protein n=1 Tax=Phytophthora megakarya TaxID=4795 RepID=A0A225W3R4_9STRA|nr:hypothetical protein PHMEG_00015094 [Phytophthora megakarya]